MFKVLPIIDWDNRTVYQYPQRRPYTIRCGDQGYLSVKVIRNTNPQMGAGYGGRRRDTLQPEARVYARRVIVLTRYNYTFSVMKPRRQPDFKLVILLTIFGVSNILRLHHSTNVR